MKSDQQFQEEQTREDQYRGGPTPGSDKTDEALSLFALAAGFITIMVVIAAVVVAVRILN